MSDLRIPCPLGNQVQKKSSRLGSAAQELADLEEMEADYVLPFLDRLSQAIIQPKRPNEDNPKPPASPQDDFNVHLNHVGDDIRMMTYNSSSESESDVDSAEHWQANEISEQIFRAKSSRASFTDEHKPLPVTHELNLTRLKVASRNLCPNDVAQPYTV
ncbi:hypothetical protein DFH28DRAFT_929140 [Melampsora americana]|nr:hypothetical protein DFH28DRAFT_929140 [Melampsora americana]